MKNIQYLNFYTWAWILYLLQGIVYPSGIIGQMLFLIIIAFGFYAMIKVLSQKKNPKFFLFLTILVLMYTVYGIALILKGPVRGAAQVDDYSTLTYLKTYLLSLTPIYVYYFFSNKKILSESWLRKYSFVFLLLSVAVFLHNQMQMQALTGNDEITNNASYGFVALLPISIFWSKKPIVQYLIIGIAAIFTLVSMKRGAILVFTLSVLPIIVASLKNSNTKTKVFTFLGVLVFVYVIYITIQDLISTSDLFALRIEQTLEGKSSNRDIIYEELWSAFGDYNVFDSLFGRGADASISIAGKLAHNDWLETLIDQGLAGILVFFMFWMSMLHTFFQTKKGTIASLAILVIFISGFSRTWFSMSIGQMSIYYTAVLGYCLVGDNFKERSKK